MRFPAIIKYHVNSDVYVNHAEGRMAYYFPGTDPGAPPPIWQMEFTLRDHLGNSRLTFADKNGDGYVQINEEGEWSGTPIPVGYSEVLQENHYYPFGMNMDGPWRMPTGIEKENMYQYNGKELNEELGLGWSDYGARWYDAAKKGPSLPFFIVHIDVYPDGTGQAEEPDEQNG